MRPGSDLAVAQARRKHVAIDRPVDVVLDVFFAAPDELYRTVGLLGYAHGLLDEVDLEPATKSTAEDDCARSLFPAAGRSLWPRSPGLASAPESRPRARTNRVARVRCSSSAPSSRVRETASRTP